MPVRPSQFCDWWSTQLKPNASVLLDCTWQSQLSFLAQLFDFSATTTYNCLPIRLESWFHQPDLYHAYHLLNTWVKLCANFACVPVVKTQRRAVQGNWKYLWLVPTSVFSGTKRYLKRPKVKKFHYTHQSSIPTMRTHNIGVTEPYRYNFSRFLRHIKFLARLEMARTVYHE